MFSYSLLFGVVLWSGLFSGCWSLGSLDSLVFVRRCCLVVVRCIWYWMGGCFGDCLVVVWWMFGIGLVVSGCL